MTEEGGQGACVVDQEEEKFECKIKKGRKVFWWMDFDFFGGIPQGREGWIVVIDKSEKYERKDRGEVNAFLLFHCIRFLWSFPLCDKQ